MVPARPTGPAVAVVAALLAHAVTTVLVLAARVTGRADVGIGYAHMVPAQSPSVQHSRQVPCLPPEPRQQCRERHWASLVHLLPLGLSGGYRRDRPAEQPGHNGTETSQQLPPVCRPAHALHQTIKGLRLHTSTSTPACNDRDGTESGWAATAASGPRRPTPRRAPCATVLRPAARPGLIHSGRRRQVRHHGAGDQQRLRAGWVTV
jgi:hypothetical protein